MFFFKNPFIYLHVSRFLCKFAPKYNISRQKILRLYIATLQMIQRHLLLRLSSSLQCHLSILT